MSAEVDEILSRACSALTHLTVEMTCEAIPTTAAANGVLQELEVSSTCEAALKAFVRAWQPDMFLCVLTIIDDDDDMTYHSACKIVDAFVEKGGRVHHVCDVERELHKALTCQTINPAVSQVVK